jgi:hypothetical protein
MSLMRLLSAGKSLVGVTEDERRYRMGNRGLMPKFGSGKNPFLKEPAEKKLPAGQGTSVASPPAPVAESHPVTSRATRQWPSASPAFRGMAGSLMEKLKSRLPGRALQGVRTSFARSAKLPMQGELSLDRIQVVRNDLSDTDFEIAPRQPSAPRRAGGARAISDLRTAVKAEPSTGVDTGRSRRLSGRLDDLPRPEQAMAEQVEMTGPGAAAAIFRPAGAGWFASVQR